MYARAFILLGKRTLLYTSIIYSCDFYENNENI